MTDSWAEEQKSTSWKAHRNRWNDADTRHKHETQKKGQLQPRQSPFPATERMDEWKIIPRSI